MPQSVINAFQSILKKVEVPTISGDFASQFALKRFAKKFEIPVKSTTSARKLKTFEQWVDYDTGLEPVHLPHGGWYKARLLIHQVLRSFRIGELTFTSGSSSQPLHGRQSISDKLLTHDWEVSENCADLFVNLAVNDKAFVKAAKIRVRKSLGDEVYRNEVKRIYRYRRRGDDVKRWLLYSCLICREASRFSTVPKNNEIDRSIDLQQFINMLVQRAIGQGLRDVIKNHFNIDLDETQPVHGRKIMDKQVATIDLKNASDSNTWSLLEFLAPAWFVKLVKQACPPYTEGLDGHYYMTKKVSSMGNGFTFELMTLVLLSLVKQFDNHGSVFGDDIIINKSVAGDFIVALESCGWVVNKDKSFVDGPFRESCGYNFHDDFGYIRSFDFYWPESIGDCMTFWNKCVLLEHIPFFNRLCRLLYRAIPPALRGPIPNGITAGPTHQHGISLDGYFFDKKFKLRQEPWLAHYALALNYPEWSYHEGFEFRAKVRLRKRDNITMKRNAHLYFQYLYAGRRSDIVLTGKGDWVREIGRAHV